MRRRTRWLVLMSMLPWIALAESQLNAQSLDIGGIEIRLGQPLTSAVSQMRATYDVSFSETSKRWFVTRQQGTRTIQLGNIEASADRVILIQKAYNFDGDIDKLSDAYGLALRDGQKRGGTVCQTTFRTLTDGKVDSIITRCGRYAITLTLPFDVPQGSARVGAGLSLTVGEK